MACSHAHLWEFYQLLRDSRPFPGALRYPYCLYVPNKILYSILFFFYHLLFGLLVDVGLRIAGQKPM